jgi:hypothetical protein
MPGMEWLPVTPEGWVRFAEAEEEYFPGLVDPDKFPSNYTTVYRN